MILSLKLIFDTFFIVILLNLFNLFSLTHRQLNLILDEQQCSVYKDCLNCTFTINSCIWKGDNCSLDNSLINQTKGKIDIINTRIDDLCYNSSKEINFKKHFCGEISSFTTPIKIDLPFNNKNSTLQYSPSNLYCDWEVHIEYQTIEYTLNLTNSYNDNLDIFIVTFVEIYDKITNLYYINNYCKLDNVNSYISKEDECNFKFKMIKKLKIYYLSSKNRVTIPPFTLEVVEYDNQNYIVIGIILSITVVFVISFSLIFVIRVVANLRNKANVQINHNTQHIVVNTNNNFATTQRSHAEHNIVQQTINQVNTYTLDQFSDITTLHMNRNIMINNLFNYELKPKFYNKKRNQFETQCTICMESFTSNSLISQLKCKHIFHSECLRKLLKSNILVNKCPNCNAIIKVIN